MLTDFCFFLILFRSTFRSFTFKFCWSSKNRLLLLLDPFQSCFQFSESGQTWLNTYVIEIFLIESCFSNVKVVFTQIWMPSQTAISATEIGSTYEAAHNINVWGSMNRKNNDEVITLGIRVKQNCLLSQKRPRTVLHGFLHNNPYYS